MKIKIIVGLILISILSTIVYAKEINPKNISKNNFSLNKKAKRICLDKYKGKDTVPGEIVDCTNKITEEWIDQGLYEGTLAYAKNKYSSFSNAKLFALLRELFKLRQTSRKQDYVLPTEMVSGEMYRYNYTIEINFIIKKLLKANYKPSWRKDRLSNEIREYWNIIRANNATQ